MPCAPKENIAEGGVGVNKAAVQLNSSKDAGEAVEKDERATKETQLESIDEDCMQPVIGNMNAEPEPSGKWLNIEISLRDGLGVDKVGGDGKSSNSNTLVDEDKNTIADEDARRSTAQIGMVDDSAANSLARPVQMHTMNDAPMPVGMESIGAAVNDKLHGGKAVRLKPELIDDDTVRDANRYLLHDDSLSCNKKSAIGALETIEGEYSCLMPFNGSDNDLDTIDNDSKSKSVGFSAPNCDEESILQPPPEEADSGHALVGLNAGRSAPGGEIERAIHEDRLINEYDIPLIEAWVVDEQSLYLAEPVVDNETYATDEEVYIAEEVTGCYTFNKKTIAGLCSLILIALGITLYSLLKPTSAEGAMSIRKTQIQDKLEANVLLRGLRFDDLAVKDSRIAALDWLLYQDKMELQAASSNLGQRYILSLIAFEFGELFRSNVEWLSSRMECSWDSVTCNDELEVTKLELGQYGCMMLRIKSRQINVLSLLASEYQNITGTLPPEISGLKSLEYLSISSNTFFEYSGLTGTLPPEIGKLAELTELYLWGNSLSGTIPSNIGELTKLEILWLYDNYFTSTLPTELGGLEELTDLQIWSNHITGSLPTQLRKLKAPTILNVAANALSGTVPSWIGEFRSLEKLQLSYNGFSSTLPSELGRLTELTELTLNNNHFTGSLPTEICRLTSLTLLDTGSNELTGSLPTELGNLSLTELSLGPNQFTGSLPTELGNLTRLIRLNVGQNRLFSTVPTELGRLTKLWSLVLSRNQFTGTIPDEFNEMKSLSNLWIDNNQFTGAFELDISNLNGLCLSNNMFTGDLPSDIEPSGLFDDFDFGCGEPWILV